MNGSTHRARKHALLGPLSALSLTWTLFLAGCEHAPDYSIFGSFFPVWIFCSVAGLLLTAGVRAVIVRTAIARHLIAPVLLYLTIAIFFACALWLLFYR
jgi:YtcA family